MGDEVLDEYNIKWKIVKNSSVAIDKYTLYLKEAVHRKSFKVIGEISPDAKFVTENQEFDEKDISLSDNGIKIKCPCCDTYK